MTITRADVESLMAAAKLDAEPKLAIIAELCRTWLAVDDAPSGKTLEYRVDGRVTFSSAYIPAGIYKLVCIETPTGGREG